MKKTIILAVALIGLFCFEAKADRKIHFSNTVIVCSKADPNAVGLNLIVYNPSDTALTVTVNSHMTINQRVVDGSIFFLSGGEERFSCKRSATQIRKIQPGQVAHFVHANNTPNPSTEPCKIELPSMLSSYGSITVSGDSGFVIANASQWTAGIAGANCGDYYSAPFTINGGRPF